MQVFFGRTPNLVYPPSGWDARQARSPPLSRRLRRDYVFGYNGRCRESLHFVGESECVYPIAALVVILNLATNEQRFFEGHDNDVLCVAWNERRRICASGQTDSKGADGPCVYIWAPDRCRQAISTLVHPSNSRAISAVGLSPDGQTAVSFTTDDSFTFFVWKGIARWDGLGAGPPRQCQRPDQVMPLHSATSGRLPIGSVTMLPEAGSSGHCMFYTMGEPPAGRGRGGLGGHYVLWTVNVGANEVAVTQKRGVFGKCPAPRSPTGVAHAGVVGSAWLVGDNGHIYTITGNVATRGKRITPNGADVQLLCVAALGDGQRWLAGGSDGALYLGVADPAPRLEERLVLGEGLGGAEALQFRSTTVPRYSNIAVRGDLVLLGTTNQALLLVDIERRELLRVLQVSHPVAAWGMDFHPSLAILASVSEARDLRFWNVAERRPAVGKILRTELPAFSVAFRQPDGALLALGCDRGSLEVYDFPSLQPVYKETVSKVGERIGDLRFSGSGELLAAACWDQAIYLFRVGTVELRADADRSPTNWDIRLHKVLTGNSSTPTCLMFSSDGQYITSNSKDGQILYWNTTSGSRSKVSAAFRDTRWQAPWTLMMGWPVISVWGSREYDASDVKSVCQAFPPDDGYLAVGDDNGCVKLLRFPAPFVNPPCQVCRGHGAFVTRVRFSCANVLATLGGDDSSIMLWSLERVAEDAPQARRVVHPWSQLPESGEDPYGFLGAPAFAAPPPMPPRAHFGEPFAQASGGWGGVPAGTPVRARPSSLATGFRAPPQGQTQDRPLQPPAAGERAASRDRGKFTPGGRGCSSNESRGVGAALRWD